MVLDNSGHVLEQMKRGAIEHCVLSILNSRSLYGFQLVSILESEYGLKVGEGTIYPLLARLRKNDLVSTWWSSSVEGPPRRYYEITDVGRRRLREFIIEWHQFVNTVNRIFDESEE